MDHDNNRNTTGDCHISHDTTWTSKLEEWIEAYWNSSALEHVWYRLQHALHAPD
jgi:hypothetical protein